MARLRRRSSIGHSDPQSTIATEPRHRIKVEQRRPGGTKRRSVSKNMPKHLLVESHPGREKEKRRDLFRHSFDQVVAVLGWIWHHVCKVLLFPTFGQAFEVACVVMSTLVLFTLTRFLVDEAHDRFCPQALIPASADYHMSWPIESIIQGLCRSSTKPNFESGGWEDDLAGAKAMSLWDSSKPDCDVALDAAARIRIQMGELHPEIEKWTGRVADEEEIREAFNPCHYKIRSNEALLRRLTAHDILFRREIVIDLKRLEHLISVRQDRLAEMSRLAEILYAYFPFVFEDTAAGQLLSTLLEFLQRHETKANRRIQMALDLRDGLEDEGEAREWLRSLLKKEKSAWEKRCATHGEAWPGGKVDLDKVASCGGGIPESLDRFLKESHEAWLGNAERVAIRTLDSYYDLSLQYAAAISVLKRGRWQPKARRHALKTSGVIAMRVRRGLHKSRPALEKALEAEEDPLGIDLGAYHRELK